MEVFKITDDTLSKTELAAGVQQQTPVLGRAIPALEYFELVLPGYNHTGKLLTPGEVGCALSHICVYKKIVEFDTPALIFESDVDLRLDELEQAKELCSRSKADFIHLGWHPGVRHGRYFSVKKCRGKDEAAVDHLNEFYGAFAYFVTPRLAAALIDFHSSSLNRADAWAIFFDHCDYEPYFAGIFWHPEERAELASERALVNPAVYSLKFVSIIRYLKMLARQKLLKRHPSYALAKPQKVQ